MTSTTDLELVEAFRQGDMAAFNELVRRYQERVYWIARRVTGTHEDADDVVQETFVRVFEGLDGFRSASSFYTWLYRIAVNVALNALRKKRLKEFLPYDAAMEESHAGDDRVDAALEAAETKEVIRRAIDRLPPRQKLVFTLRYYEEMPYEEMSKNLGKTEGGLKANYFHALRKIEAYVKRELAQ
jgi:RNA polymerase sigma-70 factor (ECF subfamily)